VRWLTFAILGTFCCVVAAKEQPYRVPRLDDGQPDLQGVWIGSNSTPLQRPAGFTTLVISESEAARLLAVLDDQAEDRTQPTEPTEYFEDLRIERVRGELRSSIIIDPANGLIPGNDLFKKELAKARAGMLTAMDGPEQRPPAERCLGSTTVQPPIQSIRNGVNMHQIIQTRDAFVFSSEFVSATRIIRLNSKPNPAVLTTWLGDSIGRWQGDTLVVETRGFSDRDRLAPLGSFLVSPRTVVTERFVRLAADEIGYTFTVDDPTYYTQPWTGESNFKRRNEPVLEFACHEANYSLIHVLEGARVRDGSLR
jgi:hypothetical protein